MTVGSTPKLIIISTSKWIYYDRLIFMWPCHCNGHMKSQMKIDCNGTCKHQNIYHFLGAQWTFCLTSVGGMNWCVDTYLQSSVCSIYFQQYFSAFQNSHQAGEQLRELIHHPGNSLSLPYHCNSFRPRPQHMLFKFLMFLTPPGVFFPFDFKHTYVPTIDRLGKGMINPYATKMFDKIYYQHYFAKFGLFVRIL